VTDLLAATPYGRGDGSSRVRVFEWIDRLGCPAEVLVAMPHGRPGILREWADMGSAAVAALRLRRTIGDRTFWLHREVSPLSPGVIEASFLRAARLALFDLDDALFVESEHSARAWVLRRRAKAELCARRADVVIAGNEVIAEWVASQGAPCTIVPSCVDPSMYSQKQDYELGPTARIVWVGSRSTLSHLRLVLPALGELRRKLDLELVVIGPSLDAVAPGGKDSAWPEWVRSVPWSESTARRALAEMDVGVMPLPDLPYERGKCAYKLLQYAAAGLPVVGSPVGVNTSILSDMGAAAPGAIRDWIDALGGVLSAPASERKQLAARASRVVSEGFTFERWRPTMASLLGTGIAT
jgi:glycosyltransferase involved in cell wall biosynthesis